MTLYHCEICEKQKDPDYELCHEWDDGWVCEGCFTEIENSALWQLMNGWHVGRGIPEDQAAAQATSYCKMKWRLLGHV